MSNHIDKDEFKEAVRAKNWGFIWSAYQYAVNGGESSKVEMLERQLEEAEARTDVLQDTADQMIVGLKNEIQGLKQELDVAHGFHKVAVAERNLAQYQCDAAESKCVVLTKWLNEAKTAS